MLPLTSTLDGVDGWCHAPATLLPRMAQYPLHKGPGGIYGRSGRVREILPASGFYPQTVRLVASCSTDYAVSAHTEIMLASDLFQIKILEETFIIIWRT
jgi:hypothetical protein